MKRFLIMAAILFSLSACNNANDKTPEVTTTQATTTQATTETTTTQSTTETTTETTTEANSNLVDQVAITKEELPQLNPPTADDKIVIMKTTKGDIKIVLYPKYAPKTVENFLTHAKNGYYEGIKFHRVMNEFMIQGGDPTGTGSGGESIWGESFEDEFSPYLYNINGALSMANSGPATNGSQFFIVQNKTLDTTYNEVFSVLIKDKNSEQVKAFLPQIYKGSGLPLPIAEKYIADGGTPHLDYMHTVFGQVLEGMDVVDAIANAETIMDSSGYKTKPSEDILINSIEIIE